MDKHKYSTIALVAFMVLIIFIAIGSAIDPKEETQCSDGQILQVNGSHWDCANLSFGNLSNYVPYTGATTNINIGVRDLVTTGTIVTGDHGTATTDEVVNVIYGTGSPPTASTTTIGTLFIQYTP